MTDTRLADVLDALYDLAAANATLAAAVTAETLKIADGPPAVDFSAPTLLFIGGLPTADDESSVTEVQLDWATLGRSGAYADVDETIVVPCGVSTVVGDPTPAGMRAARRTAIGIYAAYASAVRASTLGIDVVMWCIANASGVAQRKTSSGSECLITFSVLVRTHI